ncbi:MAG: pyridoxamine 5'-phosphate oxidase family protein [Aquisalimonadaceae bacterium]
MTRQQLFAFIQAHELAVLSTVSPSRLPEAALVGIAVTSDVEILFDTARCSRKYHNLRDNGSVAMVIGWNNSTTMQLEGKAAELVDDELDPCRDIYLARFPEGRRRAEQLDIAYFRVRPQWIRYTNYNQFPPRVMEMTLD